MLGIARSKIAGSSSSLYAQIKELIILSWKQCDNPQCVLYVMGATLIVSDVIPLLDCCEVQPWHSSETALVYQKGAMFLFCAATTQRGFVAAVYD